MRLRSLLPTITESFSRDPIQLAIQRRNLLRPRTIFIQLGRAQGCPFLKRLNLDRDQVLDFVLDGEGWIRHHGEPPHTILGREATLEAVKKSVPIHLIVILFHRLLESCGRTPLQKTKWRLRQTL
jgi:hypothetical protein